MPGRATSIRAIFFALIAIFLYTRSGALYTLYVNRSGALKAVNNLPDFQVRFPDVVRNCEDAYMNNAEGWAILSCNPGRDTWNTVMGVFINSTSPPETGLYLYNYADGPLTPPAKLDLVGFSAPPEDFHPLGVEYHGQSQTLFLVNHAKSGPRLDIFNFSASDHAARHIRSILHPGLPTPNSIAAISGTSILVTNDHVFRQLDSRAFALFETYKALPLATVVRVDFDHDPDGPVTVKTLAKQAFPNGIALFNDTTVAVASSSGARVNIYTSTSGFAKDTEDVLLANAIHVPFVPDNLSIDKSGTLLIGGHPHAPSLEAVARANARCSEPGADTLGCPKAASWVAQWTPARGLEDLYVGYEFGTAVTALRDVQRGKGLAVGLYAKGIMTWAES